MKTELPHVSRVRKAGDRRKPRPGRTPEQTAFARRLRREASLTEKKLWPHLVREQMGAPFRHQHVTGAKYPDYCCVPLRLIVEIDGPDHDRIRDAARDALLSKRGFDVLRFSVQDVDRNLQGVIDTIYDAVQLRLARNAEEEHDGVNLNGGTR